MATRIYTKAAKGRPATQLNPEIEANLRATYDGSATGVHHLAQQYGVTDSTIRAWASKLGLTRRSRPRQHVAPAAPQPWKITLEPLDDEKGPAVIFSTAGMTVDPLRTYLNEMGQYSRLTAHQERLLGERAAQGDVEAKHFLILANLRLVVRVAKHYAAKSRGMLDLLDLIQEGTLGLMHAVDIFDVQRGWRFSTVAAWWIRQAVTRAVANQGRVIRLPVGAQEQIQDLHEILQNTHEDPPIPAIAERLSLSIKRVHELLIASQQIYSLDTPTFGEHDDLEIGHLLESSVPTPQEHIEALDLRQHLVALVQTLRRPRDRQVIILRYGLDGKGERTLEEVGQQLRVTRERIRQIETRALLELRQEAQARQLQEYLSA